MRRDLGRIAQQHFDVIVIGGGINGAATAHMAAQAGMKVCLLEKNDFASGTSSRSSKLLHGGIRYLENLEFDLVAESLRERYLQWQSVPHLAKALPFVIPVYRGDKRPLWMMQLGVWLYDMLSGTYAVGPHRTMSVKDVLGLVPGINRDGLVGAVEYYDVQMDDSRLVLENVLTADNFGAAVMNWAQVVDLIKTNGLIKGVKVKDALTGQVFDVYADTVIATVGPWADQFKSKDIPNQMPRLRATKGAHVVYQGLIAPKAFLLQAKQDNRVFFVIPFRGNTLIGTTDTDYDGDLDDVACDTADVGYLLTEASRVFPHIQFDQNKIISTFAGLRPLVYDPRSPSKISRKHVIERASSGVWYVMGGKYTTYRAMAQETLEKALPAWKGKIPQPQAWMLYGSGAVNQELRLLRNRYGVSVETIRYLIGVYGARFEDVLKIALDKPELRDPLCSCSLAIGAQVIYSRDVEMAMKPEDIFCQRLSLQYNACLTKQCLVNIRRLFG